MTARYLYLKMSFERNNLTGQTKAKMNSEVDCEGKKMKMDNSMEFEGKDSHGHHSFMKHIHSQHHGENSGGLKEGLNKFAFVLGIFNSIKIEEKEDKSAILSLSLEEIPEEIKKAIKEKHQNGDKQHEKIHEEHQHHLFMKEFHDMEKTDFNLNIFVNKNYEIERVTLKLNGDKTEEKTGQHNMKLEAELCLNW